MNQSVLFVDDEPNVLRSYERALRRWRDLWMMTFLSDSVAALESAERSPPDAIVLDIRMPRVDGMEFLARMRRSRILCDVPAVLVTGEADKALKRKALDLGAVDLLSKPVDDDDLVARIRSALTIKFQADALRGHAAAMEDQARRRAADLRRLVDASIERFSRLSALRDGAPDDHIYRVGRHARRVARAMGFDCEFADAVGAAAALHDIGLLVAQDAGETPAHCLAGARLLLDERSPSLATTNAAEPPDLSLRLAASIARSHHERWNGRGFPDGRFGLETPVEARIVAVCDAFDVARRIDGRSLDDALQMLRADSGERFDPETVDAFIATLVDEPAARVDLSPFVQAPRLEGTVDETRTVCG